MTKPTITPELAQIRDAINGLCATFDDDYWLRLDREHRFPHEFRNAIAQAGWLGIAMPEEYGGAGLGVTEAAYMMQLVASSAGTMAACSSIHINVFGPNAMVTHGTEEQRRRMLPPLIRGEDITAFGVTEPDAGLNTTQLTTRATRTRDGYVINGQKVWTSTAQVANKIMLLARTAPYDPQHPIDGITLFYTDLDRRHIEVREIEKLGRAAVDSNAIFITDLPVPEGDRIGQEGQGFRIILDSLNPERILVAAEAIGIGRRALAKATAYAKERIVFGRPIGQNQAIQHPLAESWAELEAANLMAFHAAELYDAGLPCGPEANAAKILGAEAGHTACDRAVRTHGGFGYAKEYHVERYFRESMLPRLAPVSRELVLSHIAERVLGLPKSY
ncbi:acyl-CoA dehydrogenase [Verticiella sediminum]|uniref:Acyl-CoA dehydrogenase n=1 Tax=Verticiella sediminum TaxID=1247510 RepID=A0A556ACL6_9BURK|nr:acyl-CoA dehydrogenase family protein [Verticiella sediminum]TSH90620.1 acyl-CoA dehydrogenase [Verticiella sediminum]